MTKNWVCSIWIILFLFEVKFLHAQNEVPLTNTEIESLVNPDQKKWRNVYLSLGGEFIDKHSINSNLLAQEIPEIADDLFYFGLGFSYRNQDFLDTFESELGFNFANNTNADSDFGNSYTELQLQLRYERKLAELKSAFFAIGLQGKYVFAGLDLYPENAEVNLDALSCSPNNTSLQHQALFFGPSFSFNYIHGDNNRLLLRMMVNYDFNLYAGNWEAEYGTIVNSFKENSARFSIKLIIPLYF
jgi:hypothetical protein